MCIFSWDSAETFRLQWCDHTRCAFELLKPGPEGFVFLDKLTRVLMINEFNNSRYVKLGVRQTGFDRYIRLHSMITLCYDGPRDRRWSKYVCVFGRYGYATVCHVFMFNYFNRGFNQGRLFGFSDTSFPISVLKTVLNS